MNKKLLVLLPIAMLALAGCNVPAEGGDVTPGGDDSGEQGGGGGGQTSGDKIVFDFSSRTEHGVEGATDATKNAPYIDSVVDGGAIAFMQACITTNNAILLTEVASRSVTSGNGQGGAYEYQGGFLKFGTGSKFGTLDLTFAKEVKKVTVMAHDWYKKDADHATNSNGLSVNEAKQVAPYNEEGTFGKLEYTLADPNTVINLASYSTNESATGARLFVQSIEVEF